MLLEILFIFYAKLKILTHYLLKLFIYVFISCWFRRQTAIFLYIVLEKKLFEDFFFQLTIKVYLKTCAAYNFFCIIIFKKFIIEILLSFFYINFPFLQHKFIIFVKSSFAIFCVAKHEMVAIFFMLTNITVIYCLIKIIDNKPFLAINDIFICIVYVIFTLILNITI